MKIDENNVGNFYVGNSNECYIQGEFYSLGYEAAKSSPDIGYDLYITNHAKEKFLNAEPKQFNVQIKSAVVPYKGKCTFYISNDDLDMIIKDTNGYLICVFCKPIFSNRTNERTVYRDIINDSIDKSIDEHFIEEWNKKEYVSFTELFNFCISFDGFIRDYIWFNNKHLAKLQEMEILRKTNDDKWYIMFNINDGAMNFINKDGTNYINHSGIGQSIISDDLFKLSNLVCDDKEPTFFVGEQYI